MTAQISKSEQDERGLLPYPVIIAATKGDPEAMCRTALRKLHSVPVYAKAA